MSRNNKVNTKNFKRDMEEFYANAKTANYASSIRMREILYHILRETTKSRYDENYRSYSLYERTYALQDTIRQFENVTSHNTYGSKTKISVGWKMSELNNHAPSSKWGEYSVEGTHRSFFGSAKYGTAIGSPVATPIILNDMKFNVYAKHKNEFYRFIEDSMSYYAQSVYSKSSYVEAFNECMEGYANKRKR